MQADAARLAEAAAVLTLRSMAEQALPEQLQATLAAWGEESSP
jgi:hypothetical protein